MVKGPQTKWGICSRTVSFDNTPYTLACWNDLIAAGFFSGHILTLDAITGIRTSILLGHTECVRSLVFSSDGKLLVSGSYDKTINLWDVQTGGIIKTLHGHTDWVYSVSIAMDHTMIASGSVDKTICLWDTQTGERCHITDKLNGYISSVTFSPTNPQLLISRTCHNTIQQWDTNGHQIGPPYEGTDVAFSPDGTCLVMQAGEFTTSQNSNSGVVITTICVPGSDIKCCCFSPDGRFMAGASGSTTYVWDITGSKPYLIETCSGHTGNITSLAFCSSLISSSNDRSIKFWQIGAPLMDPVATDPEHIPSTPVSIVSIALQGKDGIAISCDGAGVVRTWDTLTGLCKASLHTSAGFSNEIDMRVVDNRLIVVWYTFRGVYIWDNKKEQHLHQATGFNSLIKGLKISGDGSKVFLLDQWYLQALSTQIEKAVSKVKFRGETLDDPLIVDGSRVWVQTRCSPIQGWDFGTPDPIPIPLSNMPPDPSRSCLDFINGTMEGNTGPSRIKDTVTGEDIYQLPMRYANFTTAKWDGQYLVTGYQSGEVMILDFKHLTPQ